jgi:hypothetical protein
MWLVVVMMMMKLGGFVVDLNLSAKQVCGSVAGLWLACGLAFATRHVTIIHRPHPHLHLRQPQVRADLNQPLVYI